MFLTQEKPDMDDFEEEKKDFVQEKVLRKMWIFLHILLFLNNLWILKKFKKKKNAFLAAEGGRPRPPPPLADAKH